MIEELAGELYIVLNKDNVVGNMYRKMWDMMAIAGEDIPSSFTTAIRLLEESGIFIRDTHETNISSLLSACTPPISSFSPTAKTLRSAGYNGGALPDILRNQPRIGAKLIAAQRRVAAMASGRQTDPFPDNSLDREDQRRVRWIYTDGSYSPRSKTAGYGIVLLDEERQVLQALSFPYPFETTGQQTSYLAESFAILAALRLLCDRREGELEIVSDCQAAVKAFIKTTEGGLRDVMRGACPTNMDANCRDAQRIVGSRM